MPRTKRRRPLLVLGLLAVAVVGVGIVAVVMAWPPSDPEPIWERAITAFEQARYDEAEVGLRQLARLRPPTGLDWGLRARLAMVHEQTDQALDALSHIPENHPLRPWADEVTGQLELRRHRYPAADAALRRAIARNPDLIQARRERIYLLAMQLRRRELDAAFEALAAQTPLTYRETWIWSMVPDMIWWYPDEHVETLARALKADPDDRLSRLAQAENYRRLARYDAARAILEPLPDDDPDARALRARLALDLGDPEAAAESVAEGPEEHAELARLRGQLALARRDADEAVRQFRIAHRLEPDTRASASDLGRALVLAGQSEAARPYLETAKSLDTLATLLLRAEKLTGPEDRQMLFDLGAICRAVGRRPEARSWYLLALERDPLDREAQQALHDLSTPPTADDPESP